MRLLSWAEIPSNATLLDIRDDLERALKPLKALGLTSLENALPIALSELEDGNPELPQTPLVVICSNGRRSEYAAALLEALGAPEVYVLEGGVGR
jgi:rhodanese-related sulfurtransferase